MGISFGIIAFTLTVYVDGLLENAGYRIFHDIENHGGMCLSIRPIQQSGEDYSVPFLSTNCPEKNAAWRWSLLSRKRLMNVQTRRCIGVRKLRSKEVASLVACDEERDSHLSLTCGADYSIEMSSYILNHDFIYDKWVIVGARVILESKQYTKQSKWIIYSSNSTNSTLSICDLPLDDSKLDDNKILTTYGGFRIGMQCIFPFIYRNAEIWSCSRFTDISDQFICAVSSNLDKNPNEWGVCPQNKRGSTTKWLPPPYCSKPCGGGQQILTRRCLFEPCHLHLSKTTGTPCNTKSCSGDLVLTYGGSSDIFPVTEVYPTLEHTLFGKCVFPFVYEGNSINECISTLERPRKWCSLTENHDKHNHWGYCLPSLTGSWSSWSGEDSLDSQCSVSCGSGVMSRKRVCRYQPCNGLPVKIDGVCNTQPCTVCFKDLEELTVTVDMVADGTPCIPWSQAPLQDGETYQFDWNNYCRRPLKTRYQPYCYILNKQTAKVSWMYCDIPPCKVQFAAPGIPFTVPVHPYDDEKANHRVGGACQFPYMAADNEIYDRCIADSAGRVWCRTSNQTLGSDIAYCPRYFVGRWSAWEVSDECTKRCGGGYLLSYRVCLFPPCSGEGMRVEMEKCNMFPCTFSNPGLDSCFTGVGMSYSGKRSTTITGHRCQSWSSQTPVMHALGPNTIPSGYPALEENYCRNPTPGIRYAPWCYSGQSIGNVKVKWEYCDLVKCPEKHVVIYGIPLHLPKATMKYPAPKTCQFSFTWSKSHENHVGCHRVTVTGIGEISICAVRIPKNGIHKSVMQGLLAGDYAVCPKLSQGTTGSWKKWKCSKTCGGGFWLQQRQCLHHPCQVESALLETHPCNTLPCLDCFNGDGSDYQGTYATTYTGLSCKKWPRIAKYKDLKENFCRNPQSSEVLPWCHAGSSGEKQYCDPPHCVTNGTIPYTIPVSGYAITGSKCFFPYQNLTESYSSCQRYSEGYFCPIRARVTASSKSELGMCPPSYEGMWTDWRDTGFCTEYCGGGKKLLIRNCLFPICKGPWLGYGSECNDFPCRWKSKLKKHVDCFMNYGYDYFGNVSKAISGKKCMNWKSKSPHEHMYEHDYRGAPLDHTFCRNPSPSDRYAPWCFTEKRSKRWEYCDIKRCPSVEGEIMPFDPTEKQKTCTFPYFYKGIKRHSCIVFLSLELFKIVSICGTDSNVNIHSPQTWGHCASSYIGTWSPWTLIRTGQTCTAKCGGGRYRYRRQCRVLPCKGPTEKSMGQCNTKQCASCYRRSDRGISYIGLKNTAYNGIPCLKRLIGGVSTDACRNFKSSRRISPWCDIMVSGKRTSLPCGIKHCERDTDVMGYSSARLVSEFCVFPFRYQGNLFHTCIRIDLHRGMWCSSDRNHEVLLRCYESYQGVWSHWQRVSCTQPCGGGISVYIRYCRYAPCEGSSTFEAGKCNTKPCDITKHCYSVSAGGETYRGSVNVSMSSKPCVKWDQRLKTLYPAADLEAPECRNPGGVEPRPWCYTSVVHAELCNVPPCPLKRSHPSAQPIFVKIQMEPEISLPCIFPFQYKKKMYYSCASVKTPDGKVPSKRWCATVSKLNLKQLEPNISREYGFCDDKYTGTWMTWAGSEKYCSADCYVYLKSTCLLEPCTGENIKISEERCNDPPCHSHTWTQWSQWSTCSSCIKVSVQARKRSDLYQQSRSGTCSSVQESKYVESCEISKNDASPEEIRKLVQNYMAGFDAGGRSKRNHINISSLLCIVISLVLLE